MSVLRSEVRTPRAVRMRTAVVAAPGRVELREGELPEPGPGEVRIRLEGCGVCGSNLPVWDGRPWFDYPLPPGAPGHEGWGVVDAAGPSVVGARVGQRVAALSQRAYATHDIAAATDVVPLPDELRDLPFPGEPLGCALNIFRRSGIEPGQTVAVVGIGFLGALLTQLAERSGARVLAISRRPYALDVGRGCGADAALRLEERDAVVRRVEALTDGELCDRVIECAGEQHALDVAGALTRVRGRFIVAGFHQDGPRTVDMQLWNWRGIDVVNAHERDARTYVEGMRAAVDAVVAGILDPTPLYTHELPLERAGEALDLLRARPDGFLKALVRA